MANNNLNTYLPIQRIIPDCLKHLEKQNNIIIVAPPGTGKTSIIPLSLLNTSWRKNRKIILLEPRRIATRAAAYRMSNLHHEAVGKSIGYRTRFDKKICASTIIEVVTHGLFLRQLINDPFLENVAVIIFDEVHERSLNGDLCLTLCRSLQTHLRADLKLIAMSATPALDPLQKILACDVLTCHETLHPINTYFSSYDLKNVHEIPNATSQKISEAFIKKEGNLLAFLPGVREIQQTMRLLSLDQAEIIPLYGDLPTSAQDIALRNMETDSPRRVILATSIAETSLTVPGVRIVIDSGFHRTPFLNPSTGLKHLQTKRISKATANQRAGRAGREGKGNVYKLWTKAMDHSLVPEPTPEILSSELSEFINLCYTWTNNLGIKFEELIFPDSPLKGVIASAKSLLKVLGALDDKETITPFGKKIAYFGSHPRLAAMMLSACSPQEKQMAASIAAILEEPDPLEKEDHYSDIKARIEWLFSQCKNPSQRSSWLTLQTIYKTYCHKMNVSPVSNRSLQNVDLAYLICSAFPDRLAQQQVKPGFYRLSGGGAARLSLQDPFTSENLLAVASIYIHRHAQIKLAYPIHAHTLTRLLKEKATTTTELTLDGTKGRVIKHSTQSIDHLILKDTNEIACPEEAYPILTRTVQTHPDHTLHWNEDSKQLLTRCQIAYKDLKETEFLIGQKRALINTIERWLFPWMVGITAVEEIKKLDLKKILESYFGYDLCRKLDSLLPTLIKLQHKEFKIDYLQPRPTISAQAKYFYGINKTLAIANGRLKLQCNLLSPAHRTQAITDDLSRFWKDGWKDMRKDMKGRYPKHNWPEDPS